MLSELRIKNFAIIEDLSLSFDEGLSVLTGETGAGKSIIIDAIYLLMGSRGSNEFVRHGSERAEIDGLFNFEDKSSVHKKLQSMGIDTEDGMVVLSRSISRKGKNVCRLNHKLVTLGMLREVGQHFIDIHGQHENQDLMKSERHLPLLDLYAGKKLAQPLNEYQRLFKAFKQLQHRYASLTNNEQEAAQRIDLLRFQLNDIQSAQLELGEGETLQAEKQQLGNYEKLYDALHLSYNALYGDQKGLDWVGMAMNQMETIAPLEDSYTKLHQTLAESFYAIEEASFTMRQFADQLEHDPDRLDHIERRLQEIAGLKRKYGSNEEEILKYASSLEEELDTLEHRDDHIAKTKNELEEVKKDLLLEAAQLTEIRQREAKLLEKAIHNELRAVYMDKTKFNIQWSSTDNPTEHGVDHVEFFISTNPGEPLKPLAKVASGGELSRMMLAIKSIFSTHQQKTAIVFDEVDTGVSGRVAQAMAEKIYSLSTHSQVLCISHLPQVAAMADHHLSIVKTSSKGRTSTSVEKLKMEDVQNEIARMIAGTEVTELTKKHATELIDLAMTYKKNA
ncbi:DNA repair protein RecN [Aureibacillus halotolerans]|uniref:DNA repair protein RecN n=1 Tax=Aureibacillus halotolerans TaxID=1508390 RepID=A0A4R6U599_9BACI|nr:DNA repair protein RecN [Aureibacillus halotolerans]TDQ41638.1 DNA replication and repair protein RecN [Aureibacillus halotolerans]